jgi:hypothetical protein
LIKQSEVGEILITGLFEGEQQWNKRDKTIGGRHRYSNKAATEWRYFN